MKTKDSILLEQIYEKVINENNSNEMVIPVNFHFEYNGKQYTLNGQGTFDRSKNNNQQAKLRGTVLDDTGKEIGVREQLWFQLSKIFMPMMEKKLAEDFENFKDLDPEVAAAALRLRG